MIPEYRIEDKYKVLIYADVDEQGEFIELIWGPKVIPNRQYQYFFFVDRYVGDSIDNYKIVNDALTAIDTDLENLYKEQYFK